MSRRRLRAGRTGSFEGRQSVALLAQEHADFALSSRACSRTSAVRPSWRTWRARSAARFNSTTGRASSRVFLREEVGAQLTVGEARTDQSYLQETLRQLDVVVGLFPVRGDAFS